MPVMEKKRMIHRIEEVILILLILLNALDFFEILPADMDYAKKVISWTALGYLLYKTSLTTIFFNNRHRHVDILLIISYFMLIFKNIILFSSGVIEEFVIFYDFQNFILDNALMLELYFFITGGIIIILLAVYSSFFIDVREPSLMNIIHEEGRPDSIYKFLTRIVTVYLVYTAFFVAVFNLIMEWLAIAIDAPLIMLGLLFYLFIIMRHYRKYSVESLIYRIGKFGEIFYEKFISLFHYKKTILLGISGMLVLHLLTDALSFILPYILTFRDSLYFSQLGAGHDSLIPLFLGQIENQPFLEQFSLFFVYLLNAIGILFLLILPSFFWYSAFTGRIYHASKLRLALFFSSVSVLLIAPVFSISRLKDKAILGVDIQTGFANNIFFSSFFQVLFFAAVVFLLLYLLMKYFKMPIIYFAVITTLLFFPYYISLFFTSLIFYYIDIIPALFAASRLFLSFHFLVFFAINILFYVAGFIMLIDEIIKEKVYKNFL